MKQTDDMARFIKLEENFEDKITATTARFGNHMAEIQSAIGFQFWVIDEVLSMLKSRGYRLPLRPHNQLIFGFYTRNCHYLAAAELLAKRGLVTSTLNNIRSSYESILMMYYLRCYPNEGRLISRLASSRRGNSVKNQLRVKQYYSHKHLLSSLYVGKRYRDLRRFYEEISKAAHPTLRSSSHDITYSPRMVSYALDGILILSYANITAFLESFGLVFDENEFKPVNESRTRILDALRFRPTFEPNAPSLRGMMRLKGGEMKRFNPNFRL